MKERFKLINMSYIFEKYLHLDRLEELRVSSLRTSGGLSSKHLWSSAKHRQIISADHLDLFVFTVHFSKTNILPSFQTWSPHENKCKTKLDGRHRKLSL